MRQLIFLLVAVFLTNYSMAQLGNERGPCFQKSLDRLGKKYVDWECDRADNIVDCNKKLSSDPGSNIVRTRSSGSPYTGDCETCHNNGMRQRIVHFVNGKTDGIDTTFFKSGCPQVVRNHIDGVENGTWTYYNDTSGLVAWKIKYSNGEKIGQSIYYKQKPVGNESMKVRIDGADHTVKYRTYENDTTKIVQYKNGLLNGTKKTYYSGSKIKQEANYTDGILDGKFTVYNSDGNILEELNYDEGEKDREWKYYFNDGNLLKVENWNDGVKDGTFKTFYIQGYIQTMENYKRGMKDGKFMERFPDDKIKREAIYKRDELKEEHVYDKYGNEIRTVDEDGPVKKTEDDELPEKKDKKWWQFWK